MPGANLPQPRIAAAALAAHPASLKHFGAAGRSEGALRDRRPAETVELTGEAIEDVYELGEPLRGLWFPLNHAVGDALFDVVAKHRQADAVQGGFSGGKLLEQLDANPWFLHHPADAADLTFDPVQACHEALLLRFVQHRRPQIKRARFESRPCRIAIATP